MVTREEVLKIAQLARLELSEDEVALFQQRLGRVLDYIHDLKELRTEDEGFVRHVPKDSVAFRSDFSIEPAYANQILLNSPALEGDSYLLPPVVERES